MCSEIRAKGQWQRPRRSRGGRLGEKGEGLGGISEERVPAVASAADKFCKIKMEKYLVESVKMETTAWTLQKNIMAEAKLLWPPE